METLQYPVGKYSEQPYSDAKRKEWLLTIKTLPSQMEYAVLNLDEAQLATPYREKGWTVQQVVHHVADSHMNAYIRFKLALTEDNPVIKPYAQDKWALLDDTKNLPVQISLTLLHALHARWYEVLKSITEEQYQRTVFHPEHNKTMTLWYLLGLYAWHSNHHVAHITGLRDRMNWN